MTALYAVPTGTKFMHAGEVFRVLGTARGNVYVENLTYGDVVILDKDTRVTTIQL